MTTTCERCGCANTPGGHAAGCQDGQPRWGNVTTTHAPQPNPDAMSGATFTTCTGCSVPVWREDHPGDGWSSIADGEWKHVELVAEFGDRVVVNPPAEA